MKRNALIAAIAAATFSASAFAAGLGTEADVQGSANASAAGTEVGAFADLDANADGNLSREEVDRDPRLSSQWDSLDANSDGNLDQSEFSALEGNAPSVQAPDGQPRGLGRPGASIDSGADAELGTTPPGQATNPGASEAAPGQM